MSLGAILSAAGLAAALSLTGAQAEVLAFNSTSAINGKASVSDPPVMDGDTDVANGANSWGFEVQSAPIVSPDGDDLDRGALAVAVVPEPSWATTLLGFAGLGL